MWVEFLPIPGERISPIDMSVGGGWNGRSSGRGSVLRSGCWEKKYVDRNMSLVCQDNCGGGGGGRGG